MLQRLRQRLALVLLCLLPFHALAVTVLTKMIAGPGHAPMPVLAVWKEAVLALILVVACAEVFVLAVSGKRQAVRMRVDVIDAIILALLGIALALFFYRPWMTTTGFVLGFKYDFIPLIAFLILRRVQWSERFRTQAESLLLAVGGIVALYGILTFFAPKGFFRLLGYSDAHSLYIPSGPLAAYQQVSGSAIRRIQSTFSGPNQFGIWLLIPLSVMAASLLSRQRLAISGKPTFPIRQYLLLGLLLLALVLTFSRSAWIGAFVIGCAALYPLLPRRMFVQMLVSVSAIAAIVAVAASLVAPSVLLRKTSTWGHIVRPLQAIREIRRYPLGMGLGAAGPATNRMREPCVYLPSGADPAWAKASPRLCVFVGSNQVQPADHTCTCAMLPENWYLQIGVELGVLGLVLYGAFILLVLKTLSVVEVVREQSLHVFLLFLSISIAALFLHAWEDAAVAYTGWMLIATSRLRLGRGSVG